MSGELYKSIVRRNRYGSVKKEINSGNHKNIQRQKHRHDELQKYQKRHEFYQETFPSQTYSTKKESNESKKTNNYEH